MIVNFKRITPQGIEAVTTGILELSESACLDLKPQYWPSAEDTHLIGIQGNTRQLEPSAVEAFLRRYTADINQVIRVANYPLLFSRSALPSYNGGTRTVKIGDLEIGGRELIIAAGPCSILDRQQMIEAAHAVREAGADMLRGGAYKPRTSTKSFQGLGRAGLELLVEAGQEAGLPVVSECLDPRHIRYFLDYQNQGAMIMLQTGARNMRNFEMHKAIGGTQLPVLFKRAPDASVDEWYHAAEYIVANGNWNVVLCERGIHREDRDAMTSRNIADLPGIYRVRDETVLPVAGDPSHGYGKTGLVVAGTRGLVDMGAQMLLIEVVSSERETADPRASDLFQSVNPEQLYKIVAKARAAYREALEEKMALKT